MILVTGGTGFVGAHLLYHLAKNGKKVKAIKRSNSSLQLTEKVFRWYDKEASKLLSNIEWAEADVLDLHSLLEVFEGVRQLYHTAAMVSFEPSEKELLLKTNISGTANVVNAALDKKIDKLVFVSSIAALGRSSDEKLIDEETHFSSSVNPSTYSISKFESEREIWRGIHEGLNAVIVNPSVILGPGDWETGSAKLFQTVKNGLKFYTTGSNGFVDVNDVARAMIILMESNVTNERFLVTAENINYKQLFFWMAEELGVPTPKYKAGTLLSSFYWRALKARKLLTGKTAVITKETAKTAQQVYRYDNSKFQNAFDFQYIPVHESIKRTAKIFLEESR